MAYTLEQLRALSDDELVRQHDEIAPMVSMGTQYFVDELRRREYERAAAKADELAAASLESARQSARLARQAVILAAVSAIVGLVAVVLQVVQLLGG